MHLFVKLFFFLLALALVTVVATAQERDRSKVPEQYKWNLTDLYPSEAVWKEAKQKLVAEIPSLEKYQGNLGSSASRLWRPPCSRNLWRSTSGAGRISGARPFSR